MDDSAFRARFERPPEYAADAGGRVNLIGEHTDYHEGFVFPAALDLRTRALAAGREDGRVRIWSDNMDQEASADLDGLAPGGPVDWRAYLLGPFWALREAGVPAPGADVWVRGQVPFGGGLSSSASIEVALVGLGAALAGHTLEPLDVAKLAQRAEREFCGVPCGIMDQVAAACGRPGQALLLDCRSLEIRTVPFPEDWSILVADSGVKHALATSEYARRQAECAQGMDRFPALQSARDLEPEVLNGARNLMGEIPFRRLRHVVMENQRTQQAVEALERGEEGRMGRLLYQSQESLARDYEVSCPELDTLVDLASGLDGVIGARLTGAGFGGNTVNLVRSRQAEGFSKALTEGYKALTGRDTVVRTVRPGGGLNVERL